MRYRRALAVIFCSSLALGLTACGREGAGSAPAPKILKEQRETLDQAKGVQGTVDQQAEQARQKLEAAESGEKK